MSKEEFAGIGLALGVVAGARSFKIDNLGRLTGIHYDQVWAPGENTAECRKKESASRSPYSMSFTIPTSSLYGDALDRLYRTVGSSQVWSWDTTNSAPAPAALPATIDPKPIKEKKAKPPKPKEHTMGECECGFYGYYDGSNDYYSRGYVSGVVEGYGESLIGTRGFRVSKARIVALRIPKSTPTRLADLVRRNYAGIPHFEKFSQMVSAFPCDGGEMAVHPETDPDFWTRSV